MVHRRELQDYLAERLDVAGLGDYCPNGLQVEGRHRIERLVTGVTASARFLKAALEAEADAVLVHHGFFWKGEPAVVTGMKAERLRLLLRHDVNLWIDTAAITPVWRKSLALRRARRWPPAGFRGCSGTVSLTRLSVPRGWSTGSGRASSGNLCGWMAV